MKRFIRAAIISVSLTSIASAQTAPIPAPSDVAEAPDGAIKLRDGLAYKILDQGTGTTHPAAYDRVTANYTGWTTDGRMFDSSVVHGKPATFNLLNVIGGWSEAAQKMVEGENIRVWIPEDLAYKGIAGKPAGTLVFEIELLSIQPGKPPPPVPADVSAPPANAAKTASGLAYRVLVKGSGTEHPTATSTVQIDYTGWRTNGKMFDSSIIRGHPSTIALNKMIPGWTEGVQLMTEGEEARFWVPQFLTYNGEKGPPEGTLVFDIKLIKIVSTPSTKPQPAPALACKNEAVLNNLKNEIMNQMELNTFFQTAKSFSGGAPAACDVKGDLKAGIVDVTYSFAGGWSASMSFTIADKQVMGSTNATLVTGTPITEDQARKVIDQAQQGAGCAIDWKSVPQNEEHVSCDEETTIASYSLKRAADKRVLEISYLGGI